eukprot:CAMPEP_0170617724 /NCGR_PEP_ID=MMETSP0224-20130122/26576_1 /TAXON_ID=285029 /ORGANISM="Togula jolla, Strain CCCM 725" /LENGTH=77 /DNA_ID=CAMNT_0010943647 /DNA_START=132 /DNA_END=362 /DNA_ORIENTATION=-
MKTGGLSVDGFLQRSCMEQMSASCSIRRHDGTRGLWGRAECSSPSICTSHSAMLDDRETCGESFKDAAYFTVLREPV